MLSRVFKNIGESIMYFYEELFTKIKQGKIKEARQMLRNEQIIYLDKSNFDSLSIEEIKNLIRAIKGTAVTLLDLDSNDLNFVAKEKLQTLLSGLKYTSITTLFLSGNGLHKFPEEKLKNLIQLFENTPITTLDLKANSLGQFSIKQLQALTEGLKNTRVTFFSYPGLSNDYNHDIKANAFSSTALLGVIQYFIFNENAFNNEVKDEKIEETFTDYFKELIGYFTLGGNVKDSKISLSINGNSCYRNDYYNIFYKNKLILGLEDVFVAAEKVESVRKALFNDDRETPLDFFYQELKNTPVMALDNHFFDKDFGNYFQKNKEKTSIYFANSTTDFFLGNSPVVKEEDVKSVYKMISLNLSENHLYNLPINSLKGMMVFLQLVPLNALNLNFNELHKFSKEQLQVLIPALKNAHIPLVTVSINDFNELSEEKLQVLAQEFRYITLASLSLHGNYLNKLTPNKLQILSQGLKNIPVTSLDLSWINLQAFTVQQLQKLLQGLDNYHLTSLNLSWNNFNQFSPQQMQTLVQGLKTTYITSLNLSGNDFNEFSLEQLQLLMQGLEDTAVTSLNVSDNDIYLLTAKKIETMINGLQNTIVTSLNLSNNGICACSIEQLQALMRGLKNTPVNSLDLSNNELGSLSTDKIKALTQELGKTSIANLDISCNDLYLLSPEKLKTLGQSLKDTAITSLNFSNNDLYRLSTSQLQALFEGLKDTSVTSLNLSGNFLYKFSKSQWEELFEGLKKTKITALNVNHNALYRVEEKTWSIIWEKMQKTNVISLDFSHNFLKKAPASVLETICEKINVPDQDGNTMLHRAIKAEDQEWVDFLLLHGADTSLKNNRGEDTNILADNLGKTDLKKQVKIFQKDSDGNTKLHLACKTNNVNEVVTCLQNAPGCVNLRNKEGNTPLHLLLLQSNCNVTTVQKLIDAGADLNITNKYLKYPLDMIDNPQQKKDIVSLLLERRKTFDSQKLLSILSRCEHQYVGDPEHLEKDYKLLNQTIARLTGVDVEALISEYRWKYIGHLTSLEGKYKLEDKYIKNPKKSKEISFEGFSPENFLPLRMRSLLEIIMQIRTGYIAEKALPDAKEIVLNHLIQELQVEIEAMRVRKEAVYIRDNFQKEHQPMWDGLVNYGKSITLQYAGLEGYIKNIAKKIYNLPVGDSHIFPTGTRHHQVYVNFTRLDQWTVRVRIDNLGHGLEYGEEEGGRYYPTAFDLPVNYFYESKINNDHYLVDIFRTQFILGKLTFKVDKYEYDADDAAIRAYPLIYDDYTKASFCNLSNSPFSSNYPSSKLNKTVLKLGELKSIYASRTAQSVGNCVVKNFQVGLQARWQNGNPTQKESHKLYRWFRIEEAKHALLKPGFKLKQGIYSTNDDLSQMQLVLKKNEVKSKLNLLHQAIVEGNTQQFQNLLQQQPKLVEEVTPQGMTTEMLIDVCQHKDMALKLREVQQKTYGINELHRAIIDGDIEKIGQLLTNSVNTNLKQKTKSGYNSLHLAILQGNIEIVSLLVEKEPNLLLETTDRGDTVLHLCARQSDSAMISWIKKAASKCKVFDKIMRPNKQGQTPNQVTDDETTIQSIQKIPQKLFKKQQIDSLLKAKSLPELQKNIEKKDLNQRDEMGNCAVHRVAKAGDVEKLQLLVKAGALLTKFNSNGDTVIHVAIKGKQTTVVKWLLQQQNLGLINLHNKSHQSPLQLALYQKDAEIAALLINAQAELKYVNFIGFDVEKAFVNKKPKIDAAWLRNQGAILNVQDITAAIEKEIENVKKSGKEKNKPQLNVLYEDLKQMISNKQANESIENYFKQLQEILYPEIAIKRLKEEVLLVKDANTKLLLENKELKNQVLILSNKSQNNSSISDMIIEKPKNDKPKPPPIPPRSFLVANSVFTQPETKIQLIPKQIIG